MGWLRVESDIRQERDAQDRKWGQQNHPDFVATQSPGAVNIANGISAIIFERMANSYKEFNDKLSPEGSWHAILLEEIFEAITEAAIGDTPKLRKELVQCAAVIVAWIEAIDRRVAAAKAELTDREALEYADRQFPVGQGATFPGEVTE